MHHFSIRPDSFKEIQKKIVLIMFIVFATVIILVLGIPFMMTDGATDLGSTPYMIIMFSAIFVFAAWNAMKNRKVLFESLTIRIDDDKITRKQHNTPELVIYKKNVKRILKSVEGAFCIEGDSKWTPITIPSQIENAVELERILSEIKPLTVLEKKPFFQKMFVPIILAIAALFFSTFYVTNQGISIACGIATLIILVGSFAIIVTNKNIDKRTKRMGFFSLIVIAVVFYQLYIKIAALI